LCQFPKKLDIAFIGTAIATNYDPNPLEGGDVAFFGMWYRFRVEEALAGLRPEEKEVVAWLNVGGGSPGIGRRYFVHAERSGDGKIRLAQCGNTRPADEADKDIAYLRRRKNGTWQTSIWGSAMRHYQG